MGRKRRLSFIGAAIAVVSVVGGCASPPPAPVPTGTRGEAPTPSAAALPNPADGAFRVGAEAPAIFPIDGGERDRATGTANYVGGVLVSYTVASNDDADAIASRFGFELTYLGDLNQVRRERWGNLFAGDTLNLSPFHIFSVGDQNGEVLENDPPFRWPEPQASVDEGYPPGYALPGARLAIGVLAGDASGSIEIRSTGGFKQEVVLSSFKGDGAPVSGRLQLAPVASQDECHDTGIAVATAELSAETDQAFPLGSLNTLSDGDPSAFTTFSLVEAVQPTEGFDCYLRIVAYAPLDWTAG